MLVVVAHNGQGVRLSRIACVLIYESIYTEEDALDRELQSTELAKIMANSTRPTIFLGYVVTKPLMPRRECFIFFGIEGTDMTDTIR